MWIESRALSAIAEHAHLVYIFGSVNLSSIFHIATTKAQKMTKGADETATIFAR